ncbi:MAG: phosphoribosylamine--glycine ligase [Planctomycetes bacterium]|nr:phosphoribosylamine--glycine ligase [Planctomycetota bacterium]
MKILVIGGGGREHALVWKIAQSPMVKKIYCAPGNAGIGKIAECLEIPATDILALRNFVFKNKIDLTVVGPEAPLVDGIVDLFREDNLKIFGPSKAAAQLEGSKAFCKDILKKNGVPTAHFSILKTFTEARAFMKQAKFPVVFKADGLAAGKGVAICETIESAEEWLKNVMEKRSFGEAGKIVVAEEFLQGEEVSILTITDGNSILVLEPAQDHKRVLDNDQGPNTGGMGAYSPVPFVSPKMINQIIKEIIIPTVHGLKRSGVPYQGVLYAGLILTSNGPKVLEYNVRFGDPETQPLMVRLKSDIIPLMLATIKQELHKVASPEWYPETALCVVIASGGYPGDYKKGFVINGLAEAEKIKNIQVFHSGTAWKNEQVVTTGGRVFGVTGRGKNIEEARKITYQAVEAITFENSFYRKDIGIKAPRIKAFAAGQYG